MSLQERAPAANQNHENRWPGTRFRSLLFKVFQFSNSNRRVSAAVISMLYDRFMGAFRTHSSTGFVTGELIMPSSL